MIPLKHDNTMAKNFIAPIPERWSGPVIKLLEKGDAQSIEWTFQALQDRTLLGLYTEDMAYQHCLKTLKTTGLIGECIVDMRTNIDNYRCEAWAFLCPHPLGSDTPVYAKIGLHEDHLSIDFFSLHIDQSGKLIKKIKAYLP